MERGGVNPTCAADSQQQQPRRLHTATLSTTHARVDGHPCGPHAVTPPAVQARGDRHQLTSQLQQQKGASASPAAPPPPVSAQARHAFNLYRECVSAGMWARLVLEQQPTGEYFSLSSRPSAAAPAAARDGKQPRKTRRPNKRGSEKKQQWQRSRGTIAAAASHGQQQQQNGTKTVRQRQHANASSQQLLSNATADCSSQLPQQPSNGSVAVTAPSGSYAAAVSKSASSVMSATVHPSPATSPRMTRAKKRKATHPPEVVSPPHGDVSGEIPQLDGSASPPSILSLRSPPTPGDDSTSTDANSSTTGDSSSLYDDSEDETCVPFCKEDQHEFSKDKRVCSICNYHPCVQHNISPITGRCRECFIQLLPTPVW